MLNLKHLNNLYLTFSFLSLVIYSSGIVPNNINNNNNDNEFNAKMNFFSNPKIISIGAVLPNGSVTSHFNQVINSINFERNILPDGISIYGVSIDLDSNPIKNVQNLCTKLFPMQVHAVIVDDASSDSSISFTTSLHKIPTIGISNRQSLLTDINMYETHLRTTAPYFHQADVWIEILNNLNFYNIIFINSNDMEGRTMYRRFENLADRYNIKIEHIIEYEPEFPDIIKQLEASKQLACRVFVLFANEQDADAIFQYLNMLNMAGSGFVWIVSEQALKSRHKPNGTIAVKLQEADNKEFHIMDSIYILGMALKEMLSNENITKPPTDCSDIFNNKWESGLKFYKYLKKQIFNGKTGTVAFDEKGDRINSNYQIINVVEGQDIVIGQYEYSKTKQMPILTLNESTIIWPGNELNKPIGYAVKTHLRVATIAEKPFVLANFVRSYKECSQNQIPCPRYNTTTGEEHKYCCEGYCMDLLHTLAGHLNFTYSLHQVQDNLYGGYSFVNGSKYKRWTGLVGELVYDRTDMVVAPLTINPERSLVVSFTKPFKYQGIKLLEKKQFKNSTLTSFLQPFQNELWAMIFITLHVVGLALFLMDRFSPFGRYKLPNCDITEEDALNLSSALWFAWGVLLNSGIGEGSPKSFGGRWVGMVWASFAMIIVASYTANLAAFLVLDRPEQALSGINDERLRNPTSGFKFGTVRESAVDMYFRRQVELSNMYQQMKENSYASAEEAIAAVRSGDLKAFIWDSARLEYEAAKDCDLSTSGELFGRSGYAIGLQKGGAWGPKVTLALLGMHESGYMEDLDNKWILLDEKICEETPEKFPATLGLRNMVGVFILVGLGIFGGIGLILLEIFYKKNQIKKQRQLELARNAVDKWKEFVENRRMLIASMNELARQRYKQRQQFLLEHRQQQLNANSGHENDSSMLYTVEKGMNEIISETKSKYLTKSKSVDPRRRPLLTRGAEFETFDFDTTPIPIKVNESSKSKSRQQNIFFHQL